MGIDNFWVRVYKIWRRNLKKKLMFTKIFATYGFLSENSFCYITKSVLLRTELMETKGALIPTFNGFFVNTL